MKNMIYKSSAGDLDLSKITRLYPAVVVDLNGEVAEMSLEWAELYGDKVKLNSYVLVFDFTPANEEKKNRTILEFKTKDELMSAMQEVSQFFQN
ncbi:hypothetical protein [Sulfurimonas sp.]|jgi:hypothetical protein|uniref:hypothetical protein n=1 Tax=Sulfurimonas sp. TaxID=2022749 RepID=UPI002A3639B6|nr:hypothetical protein [Sulfurimonas sp.]MDY0123124.1 hypothetical protein [Sulfurimonas sp.]